MASIHYTVVCMLSKQLCSEYAQHLVHNWRKTNEYWPGLEPGSSPSDSYVLANYTMCTCYASIHYTVVCMLSKRLCSEYAQHLVQNNNKLICSYPESNPGRLLQTHTCFPLHYVYLQGKYSLHGGLHAV